MKWTKETRAYMWANYYSEDGKWKAWDEDVKKLTNRKWYNPDTRNFEQKVTFEHRWFLKNLTTGEIVDQNFKTLKAAKAYAEEH